MRIDTRTLPYTDFTFVLSGRLRYAINGVTYDLESGDAIFSPPGSVQSREGLAEPAEYVSFNFDSVPLGFPIYVSGIITPAVKSLINIYPAAHMYDREDATAEKCLYLLNYILLELEDSRRQKGHVYPRAARFITMNLTHPISLSDVSRELGITKEYLASAFKKESGKTVTEYINEQKMNLARNLIERGEVPLFQIAEYLGYNNYNYFCRVFKRTFGASPTKIHHID